MEKDQRVAYFQDAHATDGFDVFGNVLSAPTKDLTSLIGHGLELRDEDVYATQNGILVIDAHGHWSVLTPEDSDEPLASQVNITISPDRMLATFHLEAHSFVDSRDLADAVQQAGISYGLEHHELRKSILALPSDRVICVAKGRSPRPGSDASIEHLINDQLDYDFDDIGNIDFKASTQIKNVEELQALARITPAQAGTPGMDVLGNRIEADPGKDITLEDFLEEGAIINPEDPQQIVAAYAGIYKKHSNGKIGVLPCLEINGDVDMSVGNIDTPHPVFISGDIKQGFTVKSESDINVSGLIEDARVSAGGNITVAKGILPGKQRIKARGDIAAPYIREREIKARNVIATKSIRRCTIFASGNLEAHEVFGGETHINNFMTVVDLGSHKGHRTSVKVGLDPYINALLTHAREQYHQAYDECEALKSKVLAASKRAQDRAHVYQEADADSAMQLHQQAARALDESKSLSEAYADALERVQRYSKALQHHRMQLRDQQHHSSLTVTGTLYPPCKIQIGLDARYRVEKPLSQVQLSLDQNGHIKILDQQ